MSGSEKRLPMVSEADLTLSFRQAVKAFRTLSAKRMETMKVLRATGPQTMYALARRLKRNYSNVFTDIKALRKYGLVEKDAEGLVSVPWEAVEIRFPIGGAPQHCSGEERKGEKE